MQKFGHSIGIRGLFINFFQEDEKNNFGPIELQKNIIWLMVLLQLQRVQQTTVRHLGTKEKYES